MLTRSEPHIWLDIIFIIFTLILVIHARNSIILGRSRRLKFQFPLCLIRMNCKREALRANNQSRAVIARVTYRPYILRAGWDRSNFVTQSELFSPFSSCQTFTLGIHLNFPTAGGIVCFERQVLCAIYLCYVRAETCLKSWLGVHEDISLYSCPFPPPGPYFALTGSSRPFYYVGNVPLSRRAVRILESIGKYKYEFWALPLPPFPLSPPLAGNVCRISNWREVKCIGKCCSNCSAPAHVRRPANGGDVSGDIPSDFIEVSSRVRESITTPRTCRELCFTAMCFSPRKSCCAR